MQAPVDKVIRKLQGSDFAPKPEAIVREDAEILVAEILVLREEVRKYEDLKRNLRNVMSYVMPIPRTDHN